MRIVAVLLLSAAMLLAGAPAAAQSDDPSQTDVSDVSSPPPVVQEDAAPTEPTPSDAPAPNSTPVPDSTPSLAQAAPIIPIPMVTGSPIMIPKRAGVGFPGTISGSLAPGTGQWFQLQDPYGPLLEIDATYSSPQGVDPRTVIVQLFCRQVAFSILQGACDPNILVNGEFQASEYLASKEVFTPAAGQAQESTAVWQFPLRGFPGVYTLLLWVPPSDPTVTYHFTIGKADYLLAKPSLLPAPRLAYCAPGEPLAVTRPDFAFLANLMGEAAGSAITCAYNDPPNADRQETTTGVFTAAGGPRFTNGSETWQIGGCCGSLTFDYQPAKLAPLQVLQHLKGEIPSAH